MGAWPQRQAAFYDLHQKLWDWNIHDKELTEIVDEMQETTQITERGADLITKLIDGAIRHRNSQIAESLKPPARPLVK